MRASRGIVKAVAGQVTAAGVITAGTGFAVEPGGTGVYTITLDPEFQYYGVVVTAISVGGVTVAVVTHTNARQFSVSTYTANTAAAAASAFNFIAFVR